VAALMLLELHGSELLTEKKKREISYIFKALHTRWNSGCPLFPCVGQNYLSI
jgi:hypothetical protein